MVFYDAVIVGIHRKSGLSGHGYHETSSFIRTTGIANNDRAIKPLLDAPIGREHDAVCRLESDRSHRHSGRRRITDSQSLFSSVSYAVIGDAATFSVIYES